MPYLNSYDHPRFPGKTWGIIIGINAKALYVTTMP